MTTRHVNSFFGIAGTVLDASGVASWLVTDPAGFTRALAMAAKLQGADVEPWLVMEPKACGDRPDGPATAATA